METFIDHVKKGNQFRTEQNEMFERAKKEHRGKLDFTAYKLGHDPMYLGINGKIPYGKCWGQDSSSVQSLMDSSGYWKRLYFRDDEALGRLIAESGGSVEKSKGQSGKELGRSPSEPALGGYERIRQIMETDVMSQGRPFREEA